MDISEKRKLAAMILKSHKNNSRAKKLTYQFPGHYILGNRSYTRRKLNFLYTQCDKHLKSIWKSGYIEGIRHEVLKSEYASSKLYFEERNRLLDFIAKAFYL